MKKFVYILLLLLVAQTVAAQRLIRRSSRYYAEEQALPERVEPILKDDWYQDAPHFNMCPLDNEGNRCLVGCVATAMTQVMHYWEWPLRGTGYHEYEDAKGCGQKLSSNFEEHSYDWPNILDSYKEGEYTSTQANAIALISSDCGIAVNTTYGAKSSGARSIYQPMALVNHFGYDKGAQMLLRDFYSLEEITLMLKTELAAGRPVLVSAYNKGGGHAFVIDGYDENDWFHLHVGNPDNDGDGWSYLPYMTPDQPKWYDKDSPENGLNVLQMFTIGVMPSNHDQATGVERHNFAFQYISAVRETEKSSPVYPRNKVAITVHDLSNVGWNLLDDSVAIMLKHEDEVACPLYVYQREFQLEEVEDTTYTDTLYISFPSKVKDGVYTMVPMYRDNALDGGKEWREARTSTGTPNYLLAHVEGKKVTLSSDTISYAYLTLEDYSFPDFMINNTNPEYNLTIKNHNAEMAGRLYLVLESLEDPTQTFHLHRQGLTMEKDEVSTRNFHKSKLTLPRYGSYRLHIKYEANLFSDVLYEFQLPEEVIITILSGDEWEIASM
ncbi:MAG: C10 family peptidase [Bacteroidaceae bacterium]|nr:C10 family peptidase [Bacteroidaceae bacterium]